MTIYWVMYYGAFVRGMWWWIMNPIIIIVILFVGLFLLSAKPRRVGEPQTAEESMSAPILKVNDVRVYYHTGRAPSKRWMG